MASQDLNLGSVVDSLCLLSAYPGRWIIEENGFYSVHFLSGSRRNERRSGSPFLNANILARGTPETNPVRSSWGGVGGEIK